MTVTDAIQKLHAAARLRVAAGLLDDVAAGRTPRAQGIARVVDMLTLVIRSLVPEIMRGPNNP